ncbi:MAG: PASTA domain-containing protein [Treponema sp.]|jgi:beta-lactam-binding protein with PASTA domain|nr:PASTA domain-containing protein [Treponema sp.]
MGYIRFDPNTAATPQELPRASQQEVPPRLHRPQQGSFFIFLAFSLILLVGVIALAVFFIAVQGEEEIKVPDVLGKDVTAALLELQEKDLYPRIQLRYSQSSGDKGLILEQNPSPGSTVKAGSRRIQLVVSQGVIMSKVEDYRGRQVDEVRVELQMLFTQASKTLLSLQEPFMYAYAPEAPGTILQQHPEPGTDISGPLTLEFVVSRGPETVMIPVPTLAGLSLKAALAEISRSGINFAFSLRQAQGYESGETVVFQEPPAGSRIAAQSRVLLTVTVPPVLDTDEVFALFTYTIPKNPYPLQVQLESLLPSGERRSLLTVPYLGGDFTVPYRLPAGSVLILSMLNREIYRETVMPTSPAEAVPSDQR